MMGDQEETQEQMKADMLAFVIKEVTGDHVMFVSITICGQLDD